MPGISFADLEVPVAGSEKNFRVHYPAGKKAATRRAPSPASSR
jgi:hypothetical protein